MQLSLLNSIVYYVKVSSQRIKLKLICLDLYSGCWHTVLLPVGFVNKQSTMMNHRHWMGLVYLSGNMNWKKKHHCMYNLEVIFWLITRKFGIEHSDSGLLEYHLWDSFVISIYQHTINASEDEWVPNALKENGLMWIVNSAWNNVVKLWLQKSCQKIFLYKQSRITCCIRSG